MKIIYDADRDAIRILLSDAPIEKTSSACPGALLDFDYRGHLVGVEIAPASEFLPDPQQLKTVAVRVLPDAAPAGGE